ncbi:hypothetical protein DBV15_03622 [Temnothorax longispinosus]|uniref:Uncharacterized protein n=1 Tax=Temnothorax longispinosus TaxID=300112 RepID=A0A4S2KQJ5_9HYME|nr:hypothetical protein DBV15_03622 [Temnothorax longispinosus]
MVDFIAYPEISYLYDEFMMIINRSYDDGIKDSPISSGKSRCSPTPCRDSERGNVSREVRVVERVNPHHEVELLYGNITLIRRLMNDGPSSVRVPRLNLIRALNLPGREHDGIPCRVGKSSDGTARAVRTRRSALGALGKGRLFALRTTEQIRHADDDVDDSSRADCHANHGERSGPLLTRGGRRERKPLSSSVDGVTAAFPPARRCERSGSFRREITTAASSSTVELGIQSSFAADRPFYGERAWRDASCTSPAPLACATAAPISPVEIEKTLFAPTRSWKTSENARNRNCASKPPYRLPRRTRTRPSWPVPESNLFPRCDTECLPQPLFKQQKYWRKYRRDFGGNISRANFLCSSALPYFRPISPSLPNPSSQADITFILGFPTKIDSPALNSYRLTWPKITRSLARENKKTVVMERACERGVRAMGFINDRSVRFYARGHGKSVLSSVRLGIVDGISTGQWAGFVFLPQFPSPRPVAIQLILRRHTRTTKRAFSRFCVLRAFQHPSLARAIRFRCVPRSIAPVPTLNIARNILLLLDHDTVRPTAVGPVVLGTETPREKRERESSLWSHSTDISVTLSAAKETEVERERDVGVKGKEEGSPFYLWRRLKDSSANLMILQRPGLQSAARLVLLQTWTSADLATSLWPEGNVASNHNDTMRSSSRVVVLRARSQHIPLQLLTKFSFLGNYLSLRRSYTPSRQMYKRRYNDCSIDLIAAA